MKKGKKSKMTKQVVEDVRLTDEEITRAEVPNMSRGKSSEDNYN